MTLVWQTQRGALSQTQVGTIDIVNIGLQLLLCMDGLEELKDYVSSSTAFRSGTDLENVYVN